LTRDDDRVRRAKIMQPIRLGPSAHIRMFNRNLHRVDVKIRQRLLTIVEELRTSAVMVAV
jgi:hypothetical protein